MTAKENLEKLKSFVISLFSETEVADTTVIETSEAPVVDTVVETIVETDVKVDEVVIDEVKVDVETKVEDDTKVETVEETVAISVEKFKSFEEIEKLYNDLKADVDNKDLKIKELQDENEKLSKSPAAEPTNLEGQKQNLSFSEKMILQTKLMRERKGLSY
jgi:ABC-type uncharacterized transport system substrate-binding protein